MSREAASRAFWLFAAVVAWRLLLYLATHRSKVPEVLGRYTWYYFGCLLVGLAVAAFLTEANFRPGWRALRRAHGPILLLGGSTLFSLLSVEALLRIVDPFGLSYYAEMSRYILDRLPDPELKYRHRPAFRAIYQGVELSFNELGLRGGAIGPKTPGEYRVLLLGDSQTLGWGVDWDKTWARQLEAVLRARLGRPVRVIDSGVASYETRQEYRYLVGEGYALAPDLVLLMFMDNDLEIDDRPYDPWAENSLSGKSPPEVLRLLLRKTRLYQLSFYGKILASEAMAPRYEPRQVGLPYEFDPATRAQSGWRLSMEALRGMARSAEQRGVKFAVVHFDWMAFPFSEEVNRAVRAAVAPFPVAYVPPWFAGRDVRVYFNSRVDSHPNADGHRILGEQIAQFILDQGWLDEVRTP